MSPCTAVFAGTFDPVSEGHLDVLRRAARVFDDVIVAVSREGRETLFTVEERVGFLRPLLAAIPGTRAEAFDGLLVEFARARGAGVLLRGVRTYQDWEYEMRMVAMNRHLAPDLETVFLAPSPERAFISSTLVRQVAALGGDLSGVVPEAVAAALRAKFPRRENGAGRG